MSDMSLSEAVAALQVHARQMQAVQVLAAAFDDVSKIDQLTGEANQRLVAANKEVTVAQAKLSLVNTDIKAADEARTQATKDADGNLISSKAAAAALLAEAQTKADGLISAAEAEIAGQRADAQRVLDTIKADTALAADEKTQAEAELADVQKQTADALKRAEDARAYLANLASK